jgi:hypothetical protein
MPNELHTLSLSANTVVSGFLTILKEFPFPQAELIVNTSLPSVSINVTKPPNFIDQDPGLHIFDG